MSNNVWTSLTKVQQEQIIDRLKNNESVYDVAQDYDLHPPSLERKWRKLKKNPTIISKNATTIDKTNPQFHLRDKERNTRPSYSVYYDAEYDANLSVKIYGEPDSIPVDRVMHMTTSGHLTILFYTDTHFGEHDPKACDAFLRAASEIPHDLIIHGGDAIDCYGLSKYGKSPQKLFNTSTFKKELGYWYDFAEDLNDVSDAPKFMIFGNHMERYYNWLENNVAIYDIEDFGLDQLMRLEKYDHAPMVRAIYVDGEYDVDYPSSNILFHHGSLSRAHAGSSSRGESERRGYISSVSGHVHRLSTSYKRTLHKPVLYAEGGTLRNLHPTWMEFPDWQQGFLVIEYNQDSNYISANTVNIVNGRGYYCGRQF